jgi:solute carrier family 45, member 1/2/4
MPRTDCTPYLLALGLTKSWTSMVWIAGPLSGLIMQPIVGVVSDRLRSKYGRRRPFMMIGSIIVILCLVIQGWTKEIVRIFIGDPNMVKTCSIAVAILNMYALYFAINSGELGYEMLKCCTIPLSEC